MRINHILHIPQLLWIVVKFIFILVMTILGWFILIPFVFRLESFECTAPDSRPSFRFKDKYIDFIFGNNEDGQADNPYKEKPLTQWLYNHKLKFVADYIWAAWRNPVHNLKQKMGMNEVIVDYKWIGNRYTSDRVGYEGAVYSEAYGASGKMYPMYYINFRYFNSPFGFTANLGYKNFNVNKLPWDLPRGYSFTIAVNPFKRFEK